MAAYAEIDPADAERVLPYRWRFGAYDHVMADDGGSLICLQRLILGLAPGDGLQADHIDLNPLNNRRSNLRIVTPAQNAQNQRGHGGSSPHRGVTWNRSCARWQAQVKLAGKNHYLGLFVEEADAARAAADFRRAHMPFSQEALAA